MNAECLAHLSSVDDGVAFHIFRYAGQGFLFIPRSGQFLGLDDVAYELLGLLKSCDLVTAKHVLLVDGRIPKATIDAVAREFEFVIARLPRRSVQKNIDLGNISNQLSKKYQSPWTRLELALSENCNLACTYCYCNSCPDREKQGVMSKETAQKAIDWLFNKSKSEKEVGIVFFGGEPLFNKEIFRFCMDYTQRLARSTGKTVKYTMTTNATLLDQESIEYIKRYNFGLMVSLDGPEDVHDHQCPTKGGSGSYQSAAKGIKTLMQRRRRVTVRCTRTHNGPSAQELINFFEQFGFARIVLGRALNPIRPTKVDCRPDDLARFDREEEELIPKMVEQISRGETPRYFPYSDFLRKQACTDDVSKPTQQFRCGACRGTTTVGADGTLYPCHRFVGMSHFIIGHVDTGPDLQQAIRFWRDYVKIISENCAKCWAYPLCQGLCPWETACADGSFKPPDEYICKHVRTFFERAAWLLYRLHRDYPGEYARLVSTEAKTANGSKINK